MSARRPSRPVVVARAVLLDASGRVLLGRRRDTGRWEFPGGKVEDESVSEASTRETAEETGLKPVGAGRLLGYADVVSLSNPGRRSVDVYHAWTEWGEADGWEPERGHLNWAWHLLSSLPSRSSLMPSAHHCLTVLRPTIDEEVARLKMFRNLRGDVR